MKKIIACILAAALMLSLMPLFAFANDSLSSKLIAEWNFDDSTTNDSVGSSNATLYNDAATATGTYVDGVSGKALKLSTKDTNEKYWLDIPYSVFGENKDSFTLSIWYNANGYKTDGEETQLFSLYNSSTEKMLVQGISKNGSANMWGMKWDGTYGHCNLIGAHKQNEWVNLIYCVDVVDGQNKVTAYVNGVAIEADSGNPSWANSLLSEMGLDRFTIGGHNQYKADCIFYGMVDEIQLYAGALTADEAATVYSTTLNPPAERGTLLGEWNFDDETTGTASLYNGTTEATGTYVDGISGKALKLSTVDTDEEYWMSIPYSVFGNNKDSFTLSIWYNATGHRTSGENSELFSLYNSSKDNQLWYGVHHDGSANGFIFKYGPYGYANVIGSYKENEWVNLTVVVDEVNGQSKITAYVNGVAVEVDQGDDWTGSLMSELGIDTFTIGGKNPHKGGSPCTFYGLVDEIRLYAGALTADEAKAVYEDATAEEPDPGEGEDPGTNPDDPDTNPDDPDTNPDDPDTPDTPDTPVVIPEMPEGLLGSWDMDGDLTDSVGGKNATLHEQVDPADPTFVPGISGSALQLSTYGTDERYWLDIPYSVFGENQDTFSLSIWYKATGYNTSGEDSQLFSFYNSSSEKFLFYSPAAINFQDKGFTMKWAGNDTYGYANVISPYAANEWVHLVFAVEAVDGQSKITAYVNGKAVEVDQGGIWTDSLMSLMGVDTLTVGGMNPYKGSTNCRFYGYVDEIQIYDHALSEAEANAIYLNVTAVPETADHSQILAVGAALVLCSMMATALVIDLKRRAR